MRCESGCRRPAHRVTGYTGALNNGTGSYPGYISAEMVFNMRLQQAAGAAPRECCMHHRRNHIQALRLPRSLINSWAGRFVAMYIIIIITIHLYWRAR